MKLFRCTVPSKRQRASKMLLSSERQRRYKNLQIENQRLRNKVLDLEKRVLVLETKNNMLEQYRKPNNTETTSIPNSVFNNELGSKVVVLFSIITV